MGWEWCWDGDGGGGGSDKLGCGGGKKIEKIKKFKLKINKPM